MYLAKKIVEREKAKLELWKAFADSIADRVGVKVAQALRAMFPPG